jgi:hypothetical protein
MDYSTLKARSLTLGDIWDMQDAEEAGGSGGESNRMLIARGTVDEHGEQAFADEKDDRIRRIPSATGVRLINEIRRLSGLPYSKEALHEEEADEGND